jgi:EAL domain-containing protein (putative c-di-GMP-specific phosphodiesterase class I)
LDNKVLKDACEFGKQCNLDRISVNISPRQFRQPAFVDIVQNIIEVTGADPKILMLEVTEGIVIDDIEDTIRKMNALKEFGIRFAIDDFGTGYSSLAYLKQLPLDQLKINDKFVRDVISDASDAIIVETIILMAKHLGLNVVAEGVETAEQLDFLVEQDCHMFQGYLFSYPLTKIDFVEYLNSKPSEQTHKKHQTFQ